VSYRTVGDAYICARYALHKGGSGLVFVERSPLGFEIEYPAHWVDPAGDHFAVWDLDWGERGPPVSVQDGPAKEVWISV
jgi:hypothetical protein